MTITQPMIDRIALAMKLKAGLLPTSRAALGIIAMYDNSVNELSHKQMPVNTIYNAFLRSSANMQPPHGFTTFDTLDVSGDLPIPATVLDIDTMGYNSLVIRDGFLFDTQTQTRVKGSVQLRKLKLALPAYDQCPYAVQEYLYAKTFMVLATQSGDSTLSQYAGLEFETARNNLRSYIFKTGAMNYSRIIRNNRITGRSGRRYV